MIEFTHLLTHIPSCQQNNGPLIFSVETLGEVSCFITHRCSFSISLQYLLTLSSPSFRPQMNWLLATILAWVCLPGRAPSAWFWRQHHEEWDAGWRFWHQRPEDYPSMVQPPRLRRADEGKEWTIIENPINRRPVEAVAASGGGTAPSLFWSRACNSMVALPLNGGTVVTRFCRRSGLASQVRFLHLLHHGCFLISGII